MTINFYDHTSNTAIALPGAEIRELPLPDLCERVARELIPTLLGPEERTDEVVTSFANQIFFSAMTLAEMISFETGQLEPFEVENLGDHVVQGTLASTFNNITRIADNEDLTINIIRRRPG